MRTAFVRAIVALAALLLAALSLAQRPNVLWYAGGTQSDYIACSHDGTFIATAGSQEWSVKIWRTSDGGFVRTIPVGDREMWSIALTPDDKYVLVGLSGIFGDDRPTLRLYRISDGAYIRGYNPNNEADDEFGVAVSPNGQMVAGAQQFDGTDIYNISTGALIQHIPTATYSVKFSPDSKRVIAGTSNAGDATIFDVATGAVVRTLPVRGNRFSFSPDGQYVAVGSWMEFDVPISIVRLSDGQVVKTMTGDTVQYLEELSFSPDGSKLAVGGYHDAVVWLPYNVSDYSVDMWDLNTGQQIWNFRYEYGICFGLDFSPDGQYLYTAGGKETISYPAFDPHGFDNILKFRVSDGQQTGLTTGRAYVNCLAFSPDGSMLVEGGLLNVAEVVRASDGAHLSYLVGHAAAVRSVAFSPDGQIIATGGKDSDPYNGPDGTIRLWRASDGTQIRMWVGDGNGVGQIHFLPDGQTLIECGGSGDVRFFRVSDGAYLGHINDGGALALSPDGSIIALGTSHSQVKLYRVSDRTLIRTINDMWAVDSVAFSPDGTLIAAAFEATTDQNVKVYRVSNGSLVKSFQGYPSQWALKVAFTPDGQNIVLGEASGIMHFWRLSDGVEFQQYDEEQGWGSFAIGTFEIAPNGRSIAIGRWDSTFELIAFPGTTGQLSGTVTLGQFGGSVAGQQVTIEVRNPGSGTALDTYTTTLDAAGHFSVATNRTGTYDVAVKGSHWLRKVVPNVSFGASGASGVAATLVNGDINGDNAVTLGDFAALRAAFGSQPGDANWNPAADLNGDGAVTLADFAIQRANFGAQGDP